MKSDKTGTSEEPRLEHLQARIASLEAECDRLRASTQPETKSPQRTTSRASPSPERDGGALESAQDLNQMIEALPIGVAYLDRDQRHRHTNRRYETLLGMDRDAIDCRTLAEVFRPDGYRAIRHHISEALSGKAAVLELPLQGADSEQRHVQLSLVPHLKDQGMVQGLHLALIDISALVQLREAYRKRQDLHERSERLARLGHFEWDELADSCSYCSEELARLHGLSVDAYLEHFSSTEADLRAVHPDDREHYRRAVAATRTEGRGYDIEYRLLHPSGEVLDCREVLKPIFDDSGRLVRSVGYVQDISEQKRAQKALRQSEQRFKDFAEVSSHWLWEMGPDLRFTYISDGITGVTGEKPADYIGKTRREVAGDIPADAEALEANLAQMDRHEPFEDFLIERRTSTGGVVYLRLSGKPVCDSDGRFAGYRGSARDVTEHRRLLDELRQSEAFLHQATQIANLGHWVWDEETDTCVYCSENLARMNGVSVEDYLQRYGTHEALLADVHPEDRKYYDRVVTEASRKGMAYEAEFRDRGPDGTYRHLRERGEPMSDATGKQIRTIGFLQDITNEKERENALRESEALLKQASKTANMGHWIWDDVAGKLEFCSEELARIFGYSVDEYLHRFATPDDLYMDVDPEDREHYAREIAEAEQELRPYEVAFRERVASGELRHFREFGEPVLDDSGRLIKTIGIVQDITKHKEAEEALRVSETALAEAQRVAKLGHWHWSIETDALVSCSQEYARIHGVSTDHIEDHMKHRMEQVVHSEDRDRVIETFKRADEQGLEYEIDYRIVRPDGEVRYVLEIGEAVFDGSGRVIAHKGTLQDITEQNLTERKLRESHETLQALIDHMPQFISFKDPQGRFVYVNQRFQEWVCRGAENVVGKTVRDLYPPDQIAEFEALDKETLSKRTLLSDETDLLYPDGQTRTVQRIRFPVISSSGEVLGLGTINYDISERKRAEETLRRSEARFRAILKYSPVEIYLKDLEGRHIMVGRRSDQLFGQDESVEGKTAHDLYPRHIAEQNVAQDRAVLESGSEVTREIEIPTGGGFRSYLVVKFPILDERDEITVIGAISIDITERKLAEQALRQSEEKYRDLVEGSIQGVYIARDWKPLFANRACAEIFGFETIEDFVSPRSIRPLIAPHERKRLAGYRKSRMRGEDAPTRHVAQYQRKDGSTIWLESINRLIEWAGQPAIQTTIFDVTEQREAELALRQSEERYRLLFEQSPVGIWEYNYGVVKTYVDRLKQQGVHDLGEHFRQNREEFLKAMLSMETLDMNGAALRLYRAESRQDYLQFERDGSNWNDAFIEDCVEEIATLASGRLTYSSEVEDRALDGSRLACQYNTYVPKDNSEDWARVIVTAVDVTERREAEEALKRAHDELELKVKERTAELEDVNTALRREITERKQTELALRESEARLTEAARIAKLGHFIWDEVEDRLVHCDEEFARIHGVSPEEYLATSANFDENLLWVHPDDRERYCAVLIRETLEKRNPAEVEYRILRRDGAVRHLQERLRPILDETGSIIKSIGTIQDITDRIEAEQAVRTRDAWLRAILENAPLEIVLKDTGGRVMAISKNILDDRDIPAEDFIGRTTADMLPADIAEVYMALDRKVLETGQPLQQEVVEETNGSIRYCLSAKFPLKDDADRIIGICSLTSDITQIKLAEEKLRQAQKMEAVGKLTGGIAHDFNNLLAVIHGNLLFLKREADLSQELENYIEAMEAAANLGTALTRGLLAFSRQQPLSPSPVDLPNLISRTIKTLFRTLSSDIEIETEFVGDVGSVLIDPQQLQSALFNLALNAKDAMPSGGALKIVVQNVRIAEGDSGLPEGSWVELTVTDDGVGISQDEIERVFEPFYSTKTAGSGTGLGLSMVHGFIEQSGGQIRISSKLGVGTVVTMYLPRSEPDDDRPASATEPGVTVKGGKETVLVAEDNEAVRRVAVQLLRELGYRVLEASDGERALEILDQDPSIALLFSDIELGGPLDGYDVAAKGKVLRPDLKIVLCTGYSARLTSNRGTRDEHAELMLKPYGPDALGQTIRKVLDSEA